MPIGILSRKPSNVEVNKVVLLPLEKIVPNPNQPRKYFDPEALQELCRSIVTSGLLQPVTVRALPGGTYQLVAGERRTMAFRALGKEHIPAIVEAFTDEQSAVLALVENLQRKDLNYFEEASGIAKLMKELNLTQVQVSQRLGKAQSTVANKLRLLRYPFALQERMLAAGLTERHARALLKMPPELLDVAVEYVISNHLNVDQTERYIQQTMEEKKPKQLGNRIFVVKDVRIFLNSVNKAIDMMRHSGIPVDMDKVEEEEEVCFVLRIPKSAVYRKRDTPDRKAL